MDPRGDQTIAPAEGHPSDGRPQAGDDGVDVMLIRWMLSLTPAERLQTLQRFIRAVRRLRHGRSGP